MSNIIALVWDFDKTLIDGYMQDPIFAEYGVDSSAFWEEVNGLPKKYKEEQGIMVNPDTIYLNQFIRYAKDGRFKGLTNAKLKEFGKAQKFYPGALDILKKTKDLIANNPDYQAYDIKLEHYIVSTGFRQVITGSAVMPYMEYVWGCDLIEGTDKDGDPCISEIGYTIDNTTKTRALFEINKGVHQLSVGVNDQIPEENRRVQFINMVYVADGPSDIPAFSLVNKSGGTTFAVYPHGDKKAIRQVENMRKAGRVSMFAEADYSENTTADLWLCDKVTEYADRIVSEEKSRIAQSVIGKAPRHLIG